MKILLNNVPCALDEGATLASVLAQHSPYGGEPVLVTLNGQGLRESDANTPLREGDALMIFPRLIGG